MKIYNIFCIVDIERTHYYFLAAFTSFFISFLNDYILLSSSSNLETDILLADLDLISIYLNFGDICWLLYVFYSKLLYSPNLNPDAVNLFDFGEALMTWLINLGSLL